MNSSITLSCPDCGGKLPVSEKVRRVACSQCGGEHFVVNSHGNFSLSPAVPGLGGVTSNSDWRIPVMAINQLKADVRDLEKQLAELTNEGGVNDIVRNFGLIVIAVGLSYAILSGLSNTTTLSYGVIGVLAGIVMHGGSQVVGKEYFIQKAFLKELIQKKQAEIKKQEQLFSPLN